jgi:adenylosuccinate lyase
MDQRNRKSNQPRCKSRESTLWDAFEKLDLSQYKEFIHFGLTSQDINNTAIPLSTKAFEKVYMPSLITLTSKLKDLSVEWADIPMLARTRTTRLPV